MTEMEQTLTELIDAEAIAEEDWGNRLLICWGGPKIQLRLRKKAFFEMLGLDVDKYEFSVCAIENDYEHNDIVNLTVEMHGPNIKPFV